MIHVPALLTPAGLCLTAPNWHEVGVQTGAFCLGELLQKPGLERLMHAPPLAQLLGWEGEIILNASSLRMNRSGLYAHQSRFDGTRMTYSVLEIFHVIAALKPQRVILPHGFYAYDSSLWHALPEHTKVYFPCNDCPTTASSRWFGVMVDSLEAPEQCEQGVDIYVMADLNRTEVARAAALGVAYLENNQPAHDGMNGIMYTAGGDFDLTQAAYAQDFTPLDVSCVCPTCRAGLTRAYLHHFLQHTPLLCQRFLIQHNTMINFSLNGANSTTFFTNA